MTPPDSTDKALPPSPETYRYPPAPGGLPPQGPVESHGAVFTDAYAFIPQAVMTAPWLSTGPCGGSPPGAGG